MNSHKRLRAALLVILALCSIALSLLVISSARAHSRHSPAIPADVRAGVYLHFGSGAGGRKALRVVRCESGYRKTAVGGGGRYFGLFQFDRPTWRGNGGRGHPRWASAREQARVARVTVRRRGWQPWPVCGRL